MRPLTIYSRRGGSVAAAAVYSRSRTTAKACAGLITSSAATSSPATPRPTISPSASRSGSSSSATTVKPVFIPPGKYKTPLPLPLTRSQSQAPTPMSIFKNLFSSSAPFSETMTKATEKAQKLVDDNNVVVFSKSWCSFSRSTKRTLSDLGADFTVIDLDQESDGDEIQDALQQITGQRTVPNVFISHKHIGGNSDVQALKSKGQLVSLLKSAGAIGA